MPDEMGHGGGSGWLDSLLYDAVPPEIDALLDGVSRAATVPIIDTAAISE